MAPSAGMTSAQGLPELLATAHRLADISARAILPFFRQRLIVENKDGSGGFDPVTAADRAAERVIRDELSRTYPDHCIVGEEFENAMSASDSRWIIDPIDGTRAFIMGLPLWGTLIGHARGETPVIGLLNQPFTGERFWNDSTESFWRGSDGSLRKLQTRMGQTLDQAILSTTHPDLFEAGYEADAFARLRLQVRMTRYGGDCYAYAMVAMGFVDVVVEAGLKPFDIAALVPIIESAGGRVTAWDGGSPLAGGRIVASGDPRLHDAVLDVLSK